jgi:hypothetical protein
VRPASLQGNLVRNGVRSGRRQRRPAMVLAMDSYTRILGGLKSLARCRA